MTLVLQSGFGNDKQASLILQKKIIDKFASLKEEKLWICYRIGRQAARLVSIAVVLFDLIDTGRVKKKARPLKNAAPRLSKQ